MSYSISPFLPKSYKLHISQILSHFIENLVNLG
jgi:hypothetical protein